MKYLSFCLLFLSGLFITTCSTEKSPAVPDATLMVNLANTGLEEMEVFHIDQQLQYQLEGETDSFLVSLTDEIILDFAAGRSHSYIHVKPSERLIIDTISTKPLRLSVAGTASKENDYLQDFATTMADLAGLFSMRSIAKYKADSFLLKINEKYEAPQQLLAEIETDASVSDAFKTAMKYRLLANKGNDLMAYKGWHNYLNKEYPELPTNFYEEVGSIDFTNPVLLTFNEGRAFGESWHSKDIDYEDFESDGDYFMAIMESAKKAYPNTSLMDYCLYTTTANQVNFGSGIDGADAMITDFQNTVENTYLQAKLEQTIEPWLNLKRGMAAPDFAAMSRDGEEVKLSELTGKKVYVDVWATWCGPCIREIPALKELEAELHEENIEFVSVSIDEAKDKEKWLSFIAEKELKGVQLMAEGAWNSDVTNGYNIKGIPRFLLIGEEGKIVNANAPRPSDPTIRDVLKK